MDAIPVTKRGAETLKEEFHRLGTKEHPTVVNAIVKARAQDDLSENTDHGAAKEYQGSTEGRVQEIGSKLSTTQIIDPTSLGADGHVVFDVTINLEDLDSGRPVTYRIVGDDETDPGTGKISINSSIARTLIDKFEGDVATVVAPDDEHEYEVLAVRYL